MKIGDYMIVGVCETKLMIYEVYSLKEKRHVIKSLLGRIQSRFNVSIAEVDLLDSWQTAVIGFACVTNSTHHANEILSNIINFIDEDGRVEIVENKIEIL